MNPVLLVELISGVIAAIAKGDAKLAARRAREAAERVALDSAAKARLGGA